MNLEKNLEKLTELAKIVENDNTTLNESMKAFEESLGIAEKCLDELKGCQGKIVVLQNKLRELQEDEN